MYTNYQISYWRSFFEYNSFHRLTIQETLKHSFPQLLYSIYTYISANRSPMNEESSSKKLNYQLQEMAFQKYPFQINNKTFFCLQTYFQGQLLNGVDLELKQAKGISSQQQKIAYLQQNQEIIMFIGSNIIAYNAQKRSFSIVTQVNGYVQILRTYTSKVTNKTYIYWLESDQQGTNIKMTKTFQQKTDKDKNANNNQQSKKIDQQNTRKITSIMDLDNVTKKKNKIDSRKPQQILQQVQDKQQQSVKLNENENQQSIKREVKNIRNTVPNESSPQQSKKQQQQIPHQQQQTTSKAKKPFRICIYDYEKKALLYKASLQIKQQQVISEIFLFFMQQKMIGYVINDEEEERGRVYYTKIRISEAKAEEEKVSMFTTRKLLAKKKSTKLGRKCMRFNFVDTIMQVPLLKYNGETDQYLFRHLNTVYSLQVYQLQHELFINSHPNKSPMDKASIHQVPLKSMQEGQQQNGKSSQQVKMSQTIQMGEFDINELSKQIDQLANKMKQSLQKEEEEVYREKYSIKVVEEVELLSNESLIDIALSEVYLVVLSNSLIRFYSIFNLNTLLFKSQIHNANQLPPPTIVELNKSYLLITHSNSTLISSYTILQRGLKYNSTCEVEIPHCQSMLKLFMNSYNCQVAILARQFEIEGRIVNHFKSKKDITPSKKSFIDISLAYINFSSTRCETKQLFLKQQKLKNLLICKWSPEYLLQTETQIIAKNWRESFENKRCSCIHPTGQYLIIGFTDCFKIYAVTQEGLQNTYMTDVVRDCQSATYSEYGEHFVIGGTNTITVYASYDCSKKYSIFLSVGSILQNLKYRGPYLISTLKSKKISVYSSLLNYKNIFSFNPKQYLNDNKHELNKKQVQEAHNLIALTLKKVFIIEIHSLFYDLELNVLIFSSGQKIFFINTLTNQSLGNYQFQAISVMEYNKQLATLFIGTFTGELVAFPWPNKPSNIITSLPRFKFHSSKIIKIKITSNFKYLVTLGTDMSIYKANINYILNLKKLKGNDIVEYKSNRQGPVYCNFLNSKGICQFSHSQNTEKLQLMKQLQQEVVNTVFMLPEESLRQKQHLLQRLSETNEELNSQNLKQYEPLHQESSNLRNMIHQTKEELINIKKRRKLSLDKQKKYHEERTRDLLNKYTEMNYLNRKLTAQFLDQVQQLKAKNKKQYELLIKENEKKKKEIMNETEIKQLQAESEKNNFFQIDLIDQEKQAYLQKLLQSFQLQLDLITSQNGQLSCKNSNLEKEIHLLKYRIEELKFVSINANYSIEQLLKKGNKQHQEKLFFQNLMLQNAKVNVSQMEKKYIKATKELIEKNKLIDLDLTLYQREKEVLVVLQKTVEKTQSEIDRIVDSLQQEKQFKKYLIERCISTKERVKQLFEEKRIKNVKINKGKTDLKGFLDKLQDLEEELQNCMHENMRKRTKKSDQVMRKLEELEEFGKKKQRITTKQGISPQRVEKKQLKRSDKRLKSQIIEQEQYIEKEEKKMGNVYTKIMCNLKKETGVLINQKKFKKMYSSTEQKQGENFFSKDGLVNKINDGSMKKQGRESQINQRMHSNEKETLKIDHKSKFLEEFQKYRKDRLSTNNSVQGKFWQSTERQQSRPMTKVFQKKTNKYYHMKTEGSNCTQRQNINNSSNNTINNNINNPTISSSCSFLMTHSNVNRRTSTSKVSTSNSPPLQNIITTHDNHIRIQQQKHKIIKKLTKEEKLVNQINNEKKNFMTRKNMLYQQNQDLLNTYNSLTFDNKYFQNIAKAYQDSIKEQARIYRLNPPHTQQSPRKIYSVINDSLTEPTKQTSNLNQTISSRLYNNTSRDKTIDNNLSKMTPFEQYLKNKDSKDIRLKKKSLKYTEQTLETEEQPLPTSNIWKKPKTQQQKRMKTVPCVQFDF